MKLILTIFFIVSIPFIGVSQQDSSYINEWKDKPAVVPFIAIEDSLCAIKLLQQLYIEAMQMYIDEVKKNKLLEDENTYLKEYFYKK